MVIRDADSISLTSSPSSQKLASPLSRFAAFIIDYYILVWPVLTLIVSPFLRSAKSALLIGDSAESQFAFALTYFVGLLIILFYQALCIHFWGATIGMRLLNIKVVCIWDVERQPSFIASFGRGAYWLLSFALLGIPLLGILADPRRRGFHDRLTNTIVIALKNSSAASVPSLKERAVVRGVTWALVILFIGIAFSSLIQELKDGDAPTAAALNEVLETESTSCEGLDEAYQNWPDENGKVASRLSVAMALFAAEKIDRDCLEKEARNPFLDESDASLVFLAKSFVHSDNQELSDMYLEQVCQSIEQKNEDCLIAEVIESMASEDVLTVDQKFSELPAEGRIYSKVWALRQYMRDERYEDAAEYIDALPDDRLLGEFTAPARVKILWGQKKQDAARMAAQTAFDILQEEKKIELASWMCFEEASLTCEVKQKSCQIFDRSLKNDRLDSRELVASLAQYKIAECSENPTVELKRLKEERVNPQVMKLVSAILKKDLPTLRKMVQQTGDFERWSAELSEEAALSLSDMTAQDSDIAIIQESWSAKSYGLRWEQVGIRLFSLMKTKQDWVAAAQIGERLAIQVKDPIFLQDYAVALYRSGMESEALNVVADIEDMNSVTHGGRQPASTIEYEDLVKKLIKDQR